MLRIKDKQALGFAAAFCLEEIDRVNLSKPERDRWAKAIGKAARFLEDYGDFVEYQPALDRVLIFSPTSGEIYATNNICEIVGEGKRCKASRRGRPCYHRAVYKLAKYYFALCGYAVPGAAGGIPEADRVFFDTQVSDSFKIDYLSRLCDFGDKVSILRVRWITFCNLPSSPTPAAKVLTPNFQPVGAGVEPAFLAKVQF